VPEDFDAAPGVAADRQFKLGGQVYTIRRKVRPEVLSMLEHVGDGDTTQDTVDRLDSLIRAVLVKSDVPRWTQAREYDDEDGEQTIGLDDLNRVIQWSIERLVSRPLGQPASSGDSPSTTEPPSQETSSSLVAVPSPT
jgi:hypothetical protein